MTLFDSAVLPQHCTFARIALLQYCSFDSAVHSHIAPPTVQWSLSLPLPKWWTSPLLPLPFAWRPQYCPSYRAAFFQYYPSNNASLPKYCHSNSAALPLLPLPQRCTPPVLPSHTAVFWQYSTASVLARRLSPFLKFSGVYLPKPIQFVLHAFAKV